MKKALTVLFVSFIMFAGVIKANAITFEEGLSISDKIPMAVIIYADWADNYQNYLNAFRGMQSIYGKDYNFVELNIAAKDAKAFNSRYHIYPNLPYALMFRDGGKISRYVQRDCLINDSCFETRLKSFIK